MAKKASQKMFLVTFQQLSRMSQTFGNNNNDGEPHSVRRTAENDLDVKMRDILNEQGLNPYEKIKKI